MPVLHEPQLEKNSPPIHFLYEGHKSFDLNIICNIKILYFNPLEGEEWKAKKRHLQEIHRQKEKDYVESLK